MFRLIATAVIAAGLATPALAGPGCSGSHEKQVMTCTEGSTWDSETGTCTALPTG
ncbi:hypothetical protein K1T73_05860 [Roseovarius sp. SCSIO 43702]|uniref:hypothetical protein n=1 Tax=Roseovarius sp. SCSIO 43702 TaxID=2823043 RepID=UPI001C7346B6|nr:hypothetical protein [Roseovarius sp. SCSIO 43702]QYX57912.1 hypothetical protein K1T73_05860 [Roseovarius sp. SCSIO 43702]